MSVSLTLNAVSLDKGEIVYPIFDIILFQINVFTLRFIKVEQLFKI